MSLCHLCLRTSPWMLHMSVGVYTFDCCAIIVGHCQVSCHQLTEDREEVKLWQSFHWLAPSTLCAHFVHYLHFMYGTPPPEDSNVFLPSVWWDKIWHDSLEWCCVKNIQFNIYLWDHIQYVTGFSWIEKKMDSTGTKPTTLALLAPRANQLS